MSAERKVRLYRDRGEQTVHIPAELELPGEAAVMRREGDRLVIEPEAQGIVFDDAQANRARTKELLDWLRSQPPLAPEDRMPLVEDYSPEPFDL